MFYLIDAIRVVKRGRWVSFRRNEVTKVVSLDSVKTWMREPEKTASIQAGGGAKDGTQRNMLALEDVEYLITAEVRTTPLADHPEDKVDKYLAEIERRACQGKCYHRPVLGVREFAADFDWLSGDPDAVIRQQREQYTEDLGLMLYDVFDHRDRQQGFRWLRHNEPASNTRWKGTLIQPRPAFFHAKLERSTMACHPDHIQVLTSVSGGR